jgi:predicted transposase YdaD
MTKYVTSWERFAREEGREEGRRVEKIELVLRLLEKRFGELAKSMREKISSLSVDSLDALFDAGLEFASKDEISAWLKKNATF